MSSPSFLVLLLCRTFDFSRHLLPDHGDDDDDLSPEAAFRRRTTRDKEQLRCVSLERCFKVWLWKASKIIEIGMTTCY